MIWHIAFVIILHCHILAYSNGAAVKNLLQAYEERRNVLLEKEENCADFLVPELISKIASYQPVADKIIDFITKDKFKGETYKELINFVDRHPVRRSGYKNLEDGIDYMMGRMEALGLTNVRGEQVPVPHWFRGEETATLLKPYKKVIPILGLGTSVGTPEGGIKAPVLAVQSFEELDQKRDLVPGKIVVFNQGWGDYFESNPYKHNGASYASQYGAVATLIQSVTPFSLNTVHTGIQTYWDNVTFIPTASITMEDADLLYRLQEEGQQIEINLIMNDYNLPTATSRNVIGEIVGGGTPSEYVAVSGHVDTLDVGQGAMDDAGGVMISVMALAALKELNLTPNRTLQAILWTSHEAGLWGAQGFLQQHKNDLANYSVVFEADSGTFLPKGLDFAGTPEAGCVVEEVLKLLQGLNATAYARYDAVSADIALLQGEGVPGLSLSNEHERYFWYHHSPADTASMIEKDEVDVCTAVWAVTAYVLADLPIMLPRATSP